MLLGEGAGGEEQVEVTQWNQEPSGPGAQAFGGQLIPWSPQPLPTPPHSALAPPGVEAGPVQAPLGHSETLLLQQGRWRICSWESTPCAELGHLPHGRKPRPFWESSFPGAPINIV